MRDFQRRRRAGGNFLKMILDYGQRKLFSPFFSFLYAYIHFFQMLGKKGGFGGGKEVQKKGLGGPNGVALFFEGEGGELDWVFFG